FPIAAVKGHEINLIIRRYGKIYYEKDIYLNEIGALNFIRQVYYGEHWAGDFKKGFPGERVKAGQCFRKNMPLKAFFFETDPFEKVMECKKEIRALFDYGNNSAHATDCRDETIRIAEQLLNDNSIRFLNHSTYNYNRKLEKMLSIYKKWLSENSYDKEFFCIDAGAVLNVYGIRETRDLDFLHFGYENPITGYDNIGSHQAESVYYEKALDEIIFNPKNHFYYNGLKYTDINIVANMKTERNEAKDRRDLVLIRNRLSKRAALRYAIISMFYKILWRLHYFPENVKNFARRTSPGILFPVLKGAYKMFKKSQCRIYAFFQYFGPYERVRIYRGLMLVHTRGDSVISMIAGNTVYEPEASQRIVKEIKRTSSEYFFDVGSNIGLVSLNVLSEVPDTIIFCFEPGPHQNANLKKTIALNNLSEKIRLYQFSLGDIKGESRFAVHRPAHTSADGFYDTGRAGKCEFIKVAVETLDSWWESVGRPLVKVMKIDTEGAELLVLRGGMEFIKRCEPVIMLEINKDNFKPYPYSEKDIVKWFSEIGYELKKLDNTLITEENINFHLNETESYVAAPLRDLHAAI
ncbi:MAG: FkbM family methyltransferase, partial [Candidatus Omnitrophota bacterium]|nr:FkbM family methyltransferase [Candidatus Omnitrophota bacterium]